MSLFTRENLKKLYNLQTHIVVVFSILFVTTFVTILVYDYQESSKTVIHLGKDIMDRARDMVITKARVTLSRAQMFSNLGSQAHNADEDVNLDNANLLDTMREMLRNAQFFSSIYTATASGKLLQVSRTTPNETYKTKSKEKIPRDTNFVIRFGTQLLENLEENIIYENTSKMVLAREQFVDTSYNYKESVWYKGAASNQSIHWSDVYIFSDTKKPGLTVSNAVFNNKTGEFTGVFAIDISIDLLSELLNQSKIGENSSLAIINKRDEIIAYSKDQKNLKVLENSAPLVMVKDVSDLPLQEAYYQYTTHKKNTFFLDVNGESYIASFVPFPRIITYQAERKIETEGFEREWLLGMVVPTDEFLGSIQTTAYKTLSISLVFLAISILIMIFLARRIAHPIVQLSEEAMRIKNFDLTNTVESKSIVYEIKLLNNAITAMRHSMRAFSKFIPKVLVGKLLKHSQEIKIGGKAQRTTFLFTDIAGFTSISETYPPEKLVAHLSDYFEELSSVIFKYNGVIDKYIGDAIMAFWGAPVKDKDQALHACKAAIAIQKKLDILNDQWSAEGKPILMTRIGLHIGDVIVGNMGSSDRLNYTALGDSVNLASRLEGINKVYGTTIIISKDILNEVGVKAITHPLDVVAVKGRIEGIEIFELVGIDDGDPALLPSKKKIAFCGAFEHGYRLYQGRQWSAALDVFQDLQKEYGEHTSISLYIDRCKAFSKNPPDKDWNGVTVLHEK